MAIYTVEETVEVTAAGECLLGIYANGTALFEVLDIKILPVSSPADENFEFGLYQVSNEGTTPTGTITPVKNGYHAAASSNANYGPFSTDPAKVGSNPLVKLKTHLRSEARETKYLGEGWRPSVVTDGYGLGVFADVAPSTKSFTVWIQFAE